MMAELGKALSVTERLVVLEVLMQAPRSVESLARAADQTVQTTSHHLQKLAAVNLVRSHRLGRRVMYAVPDSVAAFLRNYRKFSESTVPGMSDYRQELRKSRDHVVPIEDLDESTQMNLQLVDVRPKEEYVDAHLPHALSIPIDELEDRLNELDQETPVLAYCRGPSCSWADQAVKLLRYHGFDAHRLEEGVMEFAEERPGEIESQPPEGDANSNDGDAAEAP